MRLLSQALAKIRSGENTAAHEKTPGAEPEVLIARAEAQFATGASAC